SPSYTRQWSGGSTSTGSSSPARSPAHPQSRLGQPSGYSTIKRTQNVAAKAAAQRLAQVMASTNNSNDDDDLGFRFANPTSFGSKSGGAGSNGSGNALSGVSFGRANRSPSPVSFILKMHIRRLSIQRKMRRSCYGAGEIGLAACTSYMDNKTLVPLANDKFGSMVKVVGASVVKVVGRGGSMVLRSSKCGWWEKKQSRSGADYNATPTTALKQSRSAPELDSNIVKTMNHVECRQKRSIYVIKLGDVKCFPLVYMSQNRQGGQVMKLEGLEAQRAHSLIDARRKKAKLLTSKTRFHKEEAAVVVAAMVVLVKFLAGVLPQDQAVDSTVDLMVTGPGTAMLVIGRISAIAVENSVV
ncbi:hypothetical protein M8C21_008102, partial [Ambrosia artemisiifolia]